MDPQRRKVDTHVENDAWNQFAFSLTSILHSYVIFNISHALTSLVPSQVATICSCLSEELSKCAPFQIYCIVFSNQLMPSPFAGAASLV